MGDGLENFIFETWCVSLKRKAKIKNWLKILDRCLENWWVRVLVDLKIEQSKNNRFSNQKSNKNIIKDISC